MDIPTGCGTKGKFPVIPTGENIPTGGVGQLPEPKAAEAVMMTNRGFERFGAARFAP